jgi:hypothetical protein
MHILSIAFQNIILITRTFIHNIHAKSVFFIAKYGIIEKWWNTYKLKIAKPPWVFFFLSYTMI